MRNHLPETLAIDFFTVPTVTFDVLYVFVVLSLERRLILHVNVTAHPYAEWAAQQIAEPSVRTVRSSSSSATETSIFGAPLTDE